MDESSSALIIYILSSINAEQQWHQWKLPVIYNMDGSSTGSPTHATCTTIRRKPYVYGGNINNAVCKGPGSVQIVFQTAIWKRGWWNTPFPPKYVQK